MDHRHWSPLDGLLEVAEAALRLAAAGSMPGGPALAAAELDQPVDPAARRQAARMMRVNHAGEVAAQGLYLGQALTARNPVIRDLLQRAATEEADHLAWCRERLAELDGRRSVLDPLWFAGSVAIGAAAGLAGDRRGLGFVVETERQVARHLDGHLARLPATDRRSRAIVARMRADEAHHAERAGQAGADPVPAPLRLLMRAAARIMTGAARWL